VFAEYPHSGLEREFIDRLLQEQIGKAASEIWERETTPSSAVTGVLPHVPPDATIHTAKVYFSVLAEMKL
jgi:hypothetical protein